ncbi:MULTISPECIES: TspO/MBR family protein [Rhodococcus erythropolis group]|nr:MULTISPECIES: TspO/MBR family protein [Rhodococcus erythropolis group]MDJ0441626.1 TspO/MBR family protein [Rhodococcus qingshengii]
MPESRSFLRKWLPRTGTMTTAAAVAGSVASRRPARSPWFEKLRKPSFQPPSVTFPVVWTVLYADIAVSTALTLERLTENGDETAARDYTRALTTNLLVNAGWSWVFFRSHRLRTAPVVAAILTASSADLTRRTLPIRRTAGVALAPYPVWCAFATVLSTALWLENRR